MGAGKKSKGHVSPEDLLPLGESDRQIALVFHGELSSSDALDDFLNAHVILKVKLGDEEQETLTFAEAISNHIADNQVASTSKKDPSAAMRSLLDPSGNNVSFVLKQKRITLTLPLLMKYCSSFAEDYISFYSPSVPDGPQATVASKKKADSKPGKENKKRFSIASQVPGALLAKVKYSFEDVMQKNSMRYAVDLSAALPMLKSTWVELRCTDEPLAPLSILEKYRPVSVVIHSLDIPSAALSGDTDSDRQSDLDSPGEDAEEEESVHVVIDILGHTVTTPPLPTSRVAGRSEVFRTFIFLGHSTPLRVLQRVFNEKVIVSVYRTVHQRHLLGDEDSTTLQYHCGTGSFSVRQLVESKQTYFNESIQLLPNRTSVTKTESTLTTAATVCMALDFFQVLSPVEHVNEAGEPQEQAFMTRGIIVMPYAPSWAEAAIGALLREVLKCKRADVDADVKTFAPPIAAEESASTHAPTSKKSGKDRKGDKTSLSNSRRSSRAPSADAGKKGTAKKGKKGRLQPPTPPPPPSRTAFEEPFKVVSPEGISGFEVIDGEIRLICLEGPSMEVYRVLKATSEACRFPDNLKVLFNSELFIPSRSYVRFPPLVTPPDASGESSSSSSPELKEGIVVHADSSSSTQESRDAESSVEAEAGGTGGRIHRIRLRESLSSLAQQQKYLLHRTLSESCLSCFQNLYGLSQCTNVWDAVHRFLFPTADNLISLERSFGQTLDLTDIFARTDYVNLSEIMADDPSLSMRDTESEGSHGHEVDIANLGEEDVGALLFFQGILMSRPLRVPANVTRRYNTCLWMSTHDGHPVLCAFPRDIPGGTIQYALEGQVVRVDKTFLLYVMEFHTLSNSITYSKNPAYTEFLRLRRLREKRRAIQAGECRRQKRLLMARNKGLPTFAHPSISSTGQRDDYSESDSEYLNQPPGCALNDDENGRDKQWKIRFTKPTGTRSSRFLQSVNRQDRPTAAQYAALWELYDERAPHPRVLPPLGPAMHFGVLERSDE